MVKIGKDISNEVVICEIHDLEVETAAQIVWNFPS